MRNTSLYILLLLFCGIPKAFGQNLITQVGGNVYYSSYSLDDLHELQDIQAIFPDGAQKLEEFPAYFSFDLNVIVRLNNHSQLGLWLGYQSTGSRVFLEDYSGTFSTDNLVSSYSIGIIYREKLIKKVPLWLHFRIGYSRNNLDTVTRLRSDQISDKLETEFGSYTIPIIPTLIYELEYKRIIFNISAYYNISTITGELKSKDTPGSFIQIPVANGLKADWSGFGAGIGIGYSFDKAN